MSQYSAARKVENIRTQLRRICQPFIESTCSFGPTFAEFGEKNLKRRNASDHNLECVRISS